MKQNIVITCGDPSGIGPEIIVKAIKKIKTICNPILIGSKLLFTQTAKRLSIALPENLTIEDIGTDFENSPGTLSKINGHFAGKAIEKGVSLCLEKKAKAIVTAPINKEALHLGGYNFPGHTEFLRYLSNSQKTRMLFYSDKFSVLLHTIHIPLKQVFDKIEKNMLIENIDKGVTQFTKTTKIKPDIVVCGLNPHAGENGQIGTEDFAIMEAVNYLKSKGMNISGPYPADTLFMKVLKQKNHVLVYAMYHDQGLIPIKTLFPKTSINVTLGLPFIRTSVNHGTAFDIAKKGIADEKNLISAVETAVKFIGG
jgi:4-hydroxythreonine-4-phosphate dehydrogenase